MLATSTVHDSSDRHKRHGAFREIPNIPTHTCRCCTGVHHQAGSEVKVYEVVAKSCFCSLKYPAVKWQTVNTVSQCNSCLMK